MAHPTVKSAKRKKVISFLDSLQSSIHEDAESLRTLYETCVEAMKGATDTSHSEPINHILASVSTNGQSVKLRNAAHIHDLGTPKAPVRADVNSNAIPSCVTSPVSIPDVVIKIEDSSSEDSNNREDLNDLKDKLIDRITFPAPVPPSTSHPHVSKDLLHHVVIENLPVSVTKEELINDLFSDPLGISGDDLRISILNQNTESIAQLYLKDIAHVQKIVSFDRMLVFKGRVISCRIGIHDSTEVPIPVR